MSTPVETFREEATEFLTDLESALLELEDRPDDAELVDRAFRAMHTIKGAGAMFGFDALASVTHHLETAFDHVRDGELDVTRELIDIGLCARDHIRALLDETDPTPALEANGAELLARLSALQPAGVEGSCASSDGVKAATVAEESTRDVTTYRIRVRPAADAFVNGMDPVLVLRELAALGDCRVTPLIGDVPDLLELEPERCYLGFDLVLATNDGRNAIEDVFIFVQ